MNCDIIIIKKGFKLIIFNKKVFENVFVFVKNCAFFWRKLFIFMDWVANRYNLEDLEVVHYKHQLSVLFDRHYSEDLRWTKKKLLWHKHKTHTLIRINRTRVIASQIGALILTTRWRRRRRFVTGQRRQFSRWSWQTRLRRVRTFKRRCGHGGHRLILRIVLHGLIAGTRRRLGRCHGEERRRLHWLVLILLRVWCTRQLLIADVALALTHVIWIIQCYWFRL